MVLIGICALSIKKSHFQTMIKGKNEEGTNKYEIQAIKKLDSIWP